MILLGAARANDPYMKNSQANYLAVLETLKVPGVPDNMRGSLTTINQNTNLTVFYMSFNTQSHFFPMSCRIISYILVLMMVNTTVIVYCKRPQFSLEYIM